MSLPPGYSRLLQLAWPIMLANAATPTLGLVDTAVMGHKGSAAALAALALGALSINFLYWGFGFLRMGTTGRVALMHGRGQHGEVLLSGARAMMLGFVAGSVLVLAQKPLAAALGWALSASVQTEAYALDYVSIRLNGAPAALATFALMGWLIGLGRTREVLGVQLLLNVVNVLLDLYWGWWQDYGLAGIAWGTVVAEWSGLAWALWRCYRIASVRGLRAPTTDQDLHFWHGEAWLALLQTNIHLLLRTFAMLACFGYFLNMAAIQGTVALAATHVLLQFVTLSAYVLDGYAHAAEPLVGQAMGAKQGKKLSQIIRQSWLLTQLSAIAMAMFVMMSSEALLSLLTDLDEVQSFALQHQHWAALYIAFSATAFQLDGVFIGASKTAAMRNSALLSALIFVLLSRYAAGNYSGLWMCFVVYVCSRGLTLAWALPILKAAVPTTAPAQHS